MIVEFTDASKKYVNYHVFFFQLFVFGFLVIIIPTCCALPKPQVQKNGHMLPVEIDEARETKKQEVNYETKRDADLHESVNGGRD